MPVFRKIYRLMSEGMQIDGGEMLTAATQPKSAVLKDQNSLDGHRPAFRRRAAGARQLSHLQGKWEAAGLHG